MTRFNSTLIKLNLSLLTAGALLLPAVGMAAMSATQNAPATTASTMMVPAVDVDKEVGGFNKMLDQVNLTQAQRDKIRQIMKDAQPTFTQLRANEKATKESMRALMMNNYDAAKVKSLADEQGKEVSERIVARAKLRNDIYNVLTPAQQKQVNAMHEQKMAEKAAKAPKAPK